VPIKFFFCYYSFQAFGTGSITTGTNMTTSWFVLLSPLLTQPAPAAELQLLQLTASEFNVRIAYIKYANNSDLHSVANEVFLVGCGAVTG
jgi:hypothetical protein